MDSKTRTGNAASRRSTPAAPQRQHSEQPLGQDAPPAYDEAFDPAYSKIGQQLSAGDPRSSSTQSLTPSDTNIQNERRRLLLIYIHGFMGNETSFRSFPAHVHNLLTVLLAETHVVHSKIYPRYRSKKNITFARDDFSKWLEPHEYGSTDVVLLGHSMGGLLAAEVVLMPAPSPAARPFKHRILGSLNFDVPFLGMHPGVVKSGLASIFHSPEEPQDKYSPGDDLSGQLTAQRVASPSPQRTDTLFAPPKQDPNFNPSFQNDVVLPVRKGWRNAWHFINKHSDDLTKATKQLVTSHLEFGGAMANYSELKTRYARLRALEEQSEVVRRSVMKGASISEVPPRVRFLNYYTASTGRPKKPKSPGRGRATDQHDGEANLAADDAAVVTGKQSSRSPSPGISLEEHRADGKVVKKQLLHADSQSLESSGWNDAAETLTIGSLQRTYGSEYSAESESLDSISPRPSISSSPGIPDKPVKPAPLDTSFIKEDNVRRVVEKEHAQAMGAYEKAIRDREQVVMDRRRSEEQQDRKPAMSTPGPKKELTHKEREERRLAEEKLRMENEGRRMRGEPPLPSLPPPETETQEPSRSQPSTVRESSPSPARPAMQSASTSSSFATVSRQATASTTGSTSSRPKKDRYFCNLPPADSTGARDPCWVRVHMENVDEVGAHCGLFFVDERYERLVGDVAERIERWVKEDSGERHAKRWAE